MTAAKMVPREPTQREMDACYHARRNGEDCYGIVQSVLAAAPAPAREWSDAEVDAVIAPSGYGALSPMWQIDLRDAFRACLAAAPAAEPPYEPTQEMIDAGRSQTGCIATWRAMYAAFLRRSGSRDSHGADRRDPVPAVDGIVDMVQRVDMPMLNNQGEADKWAAAHQCTGDETCPDARKYGAIHPAPAAEPKWAICERCGFRVVIDDAIPADTLLMKQDGHTVGAIVDIAPAPDVADQSAARIQASSTCHVELCGQSKGAADPDVAALIARLDREIRLALHAGYLERAQVMREAAAALEAMARERDELQRDLRDSDNGELGQAVQDWAERARKAESALAASAKDAERLDKLCSFGDRDVMICPPDQHGGEPTNWLICAEHPGEEDGMEWEGPTLRAAIDAALAAQKGEG